MRRNSICLYSGFFFNDSKVISKQRPKGNSFNPIKGVYTKSTENIIINGKFCHAF